ncbi:hypothetical protein B7Y92_02120 [Candidatus Saccharibacteria bacterium 32-50-13]|nr:MAG: hypothetical protein B7Y92_02120 [Candidatus Saccharibacteria bacterium 32-50-13]
MGKNTTKKRPATAPQAVLEEAVEISAEIKAAADFTDLGAAVDYARTITDLAKREAYYAELKPLRDITAFDFYSRVKKPLTEMQAATATGDKAAAGKAATKVAAGLEAFAEISPEFRTYVKGLEDRIAALEGNDQAQDTRLDAIEQCLAALTRGEQVKPFDPHKDQKAQPAPAPTTPTSTVPPKDPHAVTDAESLAADTGAEYEEPDQGNKGGFFQKIVNAFRLGTSKDGSTTDSDKPDPRKYAGPIKTDNTASGGTHGKE